MTADNLPVPFAPRLSVSAVRPVIAGLRALGHDADSLIQYTPDGTIAHDAMMRFWATASDVTGDPDLGIHVAEAAPIDSFEMHAYALLSSANLRDAYRRAVRYQRLIHESTALVFDEQPGVGRLRHSLPGGESVSRHAAEFLVSTWVRVGRMVAGTHWNPLRVRFSHVRPASVVEHQRLFGTLPEFQSGVTAIDVAGEVLDTPNRGADPTLASLMDRYADALLPRAPRAATIADQIRTWLTADLQSGVPTVRRASEALGLTSRTLQRALEREGTSFKSVVEQYRRERAVALLHEPDRTIGEIAYLLGFSELSAFHRAFRRWTGSSPSAFRGARSQ